MDTIDYRQLCQELFGTDDVAELRDIAKTVRLKNSRNAGRNGNSQKWMCGRCSVFKLVESPSTRLRRCMGPPGRW